MGRNFGGRGLPAEEGDLGRGGQCSIGVRARGRGCVRERTGGAGEEGRAADKLVGAVAAGAPGRQGEQRGAADPGSLSPRPERRLGRRSPARPGPAYRWLSEASRGRAESPRPPTARVPTPTLNLEFRILVSCAVINDFLLPRRGDLLLETPHDPRLPLKIWTE